MLIWILPSSTSSDDNTIKTVDQRERRQPRPSLSQRPDDVSSAIEEAQRPARMAGCFLYGVAPPALTATLKVSNLIESSDNSPVSFRFLPRTMMVSPRNNCRVSMVAGCNEATELSSELDSSTIKRLGLCVHASTDRWRGRYRQRSATSCQHFYSASLTLTYLFFGRRIAVAASSSTLGLEGSFDMVQRGGLDERVTQPSSG